MTIAEVLLLDYDAEIQNTRRILERIPEDKPDWKPHDKSMPMGRLAVHVARLPMFGSTILTTDELDMATPSSPRWYLSRAKNSSPNSKKPAQRPARPSSPQPTNICSSIGSSASATKSSATAPEPSSTGPCSSTTSSITADSSPSTSASTKSPSPASTAHPPTNSDCTGLVPHVENKGVRMSRRATKAEVADLIERFLEKRLM